MVQPFSVRVGTEAWRAEAEAWTESALAAAGITVTGDVEQPRIRPWSTQLTVPTDQGRYWFKASCASMAFEPALQATIARLAPGVVQEPVAVDTDRGWMLTRDHGPTVGDTRTADVRDWRAALAAAARAQRRLAAHRDELLATGLPDAAPQTVVDRFDRLLTLHERLPDDHTARVPPDQLAALRSRRSELVDACAVLAASPLPATWQHGDLHSWNLYDAEAGVTFFDLGDGNWAHAIEILSVPYGVITRSGTCEWRDVVGAWAEVWDVDVAATEPWWRASGFTHAVNRALTWHRALLTATAAEIDEWGVAEREHLASMLDA